jgi:serine/threonine protein kinase
MAIRKNGLPEHPEETFSIAASASRAAALPEPPAWTVAGADDETRIERPGSAASPQASAPESGDAAYRLLQRIAEGGMGEVWEAEQRSLGRVIAVKRLKRRDGAEQVATLLAEAEFRGESSVAASLEHPNILPVYDLGRGSDGTLLLAMKRVHGDVWKDLLKSGFAAMPVEAYLARHLPILIATAQAVAFAHSRGVIHRDIKPAQVLVGRYGEVLLTDWGLAVQLDADGTAARAATPAAAPGPGTATNPAGTPSLMAPEQTETHGGNLGPWTDVYLLGGTLYYVLTGQYPHAADTSAAAFDQARGGRVMPPRERAPDRQVPEELERLCMRALEPDRRARLASAEAFLQGLQDYLSGAARKERSGELTVGIERQLAGSNDYAGWNAALAGLDEARRLWPDNPAIAPLREAALRGSAELALRQGDLTFAQLQGAALADGAASRDLRARIEQRRREAARRKSLLRGAAAAVFALLAVIAAGALLFSHRMQAANEEIARRAEQAEQALGVARARGDGAFELIEFVLTDLKNAMDEELTPERGVGVEARNQIASAIAGKVATPVVAYFERAVPDGWPADMQHEHAKRMQKIGQHFRMMARRDESMAMSRAALATLERLHGPEHPDTLDAKTEIGIELQAAGRFAESEPLFRSVVEAMEASLPADDLRLGYALESLAMTWLSLKRFEDAEAPYRRAIAIYEAHPDRDDFAEDMINALSGFGSNLKDLERYDEAEATLLRALALLRDSLGENNSRGIALHNNLAGLYLVQQRHDEAEASYRRALEIAESAFGPEHELAGRILTRLGALQLEAGHERESEASLRRALAIFEANDPGHPAAGQALHALAVIHRDRGQAAPALTAARRAAAIFEQRYGSEHPDTLRAKKLVADLEAAGR